MRSFEKSLTRGLGQVRGSMLRNPYLLNVFCDCRDAILSNNSIGGSNAIRHGDHIRIRGELRMDRAESAILPVRGIPCVAGSKHICGCSCLSDGAFLGGGELVEPLQGSDSGSNVPEAWDCVVPEDSLHLVTLEEIPQRELRVAIIKIKQAPKYKPNQLHWKKSHKGN